MPPIVSKDVPTSLCHLKNILTLPKYTSWFIIPLVLVEFILNLTIINYVKYTEIDWSTYMEQVECYLKGERNYSLIHGSTGPIVYPAGHLYVYSIFYFLTNGGKSVKVAQYIFMALYLTNFVAVLSIHSKIQLVPPYALIIMSCIAYRIHSIFILRLFNDPIAVLFFHFSLLAIMNFKWIFGCILFSLAVSIKMNILLFAPGLLLLMIEHLKLLDVVICLTTCASIQVFLALPFLIHDPFSYVKCSFDVGRVFLFKWTVNWKFIPEEVFLSRYFHVTLLITHLILIFMFLRPRLLELKFKKLTWERSPKINSVTRTRRRMVLTLFTVNLIGVTCSRSLHYQFYSWYYYSIPILLWYTQFPDLLRMAIMVLVEMSWNTYPSTPLSSGLLILSHSILLLGIYFRSSEKQE